MVASDWKERTEQARAAREDFKLDLAEELSLEALALAHEVGDRELAASLNHLAEIYLLRGREYAVQELLETALERVDPGSRWEAVTRRNLARCNLDPIAAKRGYERALRACEGMSEPDLALQVDLLCDLAELNLAQGRAVQAETQYKRARALTETLSPLRNARLLRGMGELYSGQERFGRAEKLLQEALDALEKRTLGAHPEAARCLAGLARLYDRQIKLARARTPLHVDRERLRLVERCLLRAVEIQTRALGGGHPEVSALSEELMEWRQRHRGLPERRKHDETDAVSGTAGAASDDGLGG